jgi:hypothetical protein
VEFLDHGQTLDQAQGAKETMFKFPKALLIAGAIVASFAAGSLPRAMMPQKVDKSVPKQQRILALGEDEVKDLLLLMDTD